MLLTVDDYRTMTRLPELPDDDAASRLLADAETDVHALTFRRITARGFDALTDFQQQQIRLAIARQADFRHTYADLLQNPLASYSINGVTMSWDKSAIRTISGVQTCADTVSPLMQTGLMCGVIG